MMYSNVLKMLVPELKCRNDLLLCKIYNGPAQLGSPDIHSDVYIFRLMFVCDNEFVMLSSGYTQKVLLGKI